MVKLGKKEREYEIIVFVNNIHRNTQREILTKLKSSIWIYSLLGFYSIIL